MTTISVAPARSRAASFAPPLLLGLVVLFVLSGACGLVYQVLWVRLLSLAFGITVYAVTVVLASFMAGLAIGSFLGGRLAERVERPLVAYAIVEFAVGLVALATPAAFEALQRLYPLIARTVGDSETVLFPIRVALAFVLLIFPTTLMGATLPIVVKSSLLRSEDLADRIGLLYAANTFGAILGTVLAGFWLIGDLGISRSIQLAAATNAAVGVCALLLQRTSVEARLAEDDLAVLPTREAAFTPIERRLTLLAYGLGGVCSFALEVVWTRMLALVLDTSIYAFVTMLSMVLVGITVGSAVVSPLVRRPWNWPLIFGCLQIAIAFAALWSVWAVANLP
jgi:spermidine synthase